MLKEFWIVKLWGGGETWDKGYFATLEAAEAGKEKETAERDKLMGFDPFDKQYFHFHIHHMVLDEVSKNDKFIEVQHNEIKRCPCCDEIIQIKGQWTWQRHKIEQEYTHGERCGRCSGV